MRVETLLAWRWAWKIQAEIVSTAIEALKKLGGNSLLSGDESGLESIWEEICVQVQGEESIYWESYEGVIDQFVAGELKKRTPDEQLVVWLQTEEGCDWLSENEQDVQTLAEMDDLLKAGYTAVCVNDVAENLKNDVLEAAGTYTSENIERFLYGDEED